MVACARCGRENPDDARFCLACGARLEAGRAALREERKVVSILFADLVGFTSQAEKLDPEDVRATLSPYYARLRSELERHGGTVEKFHRRRGDGGVRCAARARGRPRAGGEGRPGDPRCDRRRRAAPGPHRRDNGRSTGRAPCGARGGRGYGRGRRGQHGGAPAERGSGERRPGRRDHLPRDAAADRLRRGRTGAGEGKVEAGPGLGGPRRPVALRTRPDAGRRRVRREAAGARLPR